MNLFPDKGILRDESFEDIPDGSCGDMHPVGLETLQGILASWGFKVNTTE